MPRPITDKERERVRHLHRQGKTRNQIAREIGRSGSTVSRIAAAFDPPLSFERGPEVVAATEARRIDLAARRQQLAEQLHQDAERLRAQMWQPAVVYSFGGKDNTYEEQPVPEPPPADKRALMGAVGMAVDRSLKLAPLDTGERPDQVRSMLGDLGAALTAAFADEADPDGGADNGG